MKRKLVERNRNITVSLHPSILEPLNLKAGDDVDVTLNINTKKIEISTIEKEAKE